MKEKNKSAQELGKLSAKKRKNMGHDKKYYSELAKKRWNKKTSLQSIWIENKWYRLLKEEAAKEQRTTKKMIDYILAERYS